MGMGVGFAGLPGSQQYETLTWFSLFIFGWGHTAGQNEEEEWMDSCWIGL